MRQGIGAIALVVALAAGAASSSAQTQQHNLILFVPDGLRALSVTPQTAPTMAAIRDQGVNFANSHSLFPTFTMPNSSAMATGHYLGDTGVFSNTIYSGFRAKTVARAITPFLESNQVMAEVDDHYSCDFIDETTILTAARAAGYSTAAVGKIGPARTFDHVDKDGSQTVLIDDATGSNAGLPLSDEIKAALQQAGLPLTTPPRGDNGKVGNATTPGTNVANVAQQDYFADAAAKAVLPTFKARNKPFVMVFWSRDPDGTQHNQGDSLNQLTPGINGPTSLAAIKNADNDLAKLRAALTELGLADTTDIIVTADHGFATIGKESKTSPAAKQAYTDVPKGFLPPGFVGLDIAKALKLPLFDPNDNYAVVPANAHSKAGNAAIGKDPENPDIVVAANGGSDLVYLPKGDKALAKRVIAALLAQDYVSGLFVDESLGKFPGTLPLSAINLKGSALTPVPAIAVNFRSFTTGCAEPTMCTVEIADTPLQQGQGMHGSFSRGETRNFMVAMGPDFKTGFTDPAPVSNADIGRTVVRIFGLTVKDNGKLIGRAIEEAMPNGALPQFSATTVASAPGPGGLKTLLSQQAVGDTRYFDAAGFAGKTVGLAPSAKPSHTAAAK